MRRLCILTTLLLFAAPVRGDWPQWRGPDANGVADDADPPIVWSEDQNVLWKTEIPGRGHSSPIVFGNRIYLLSAVQVPGTEAKPPAPPPDADERTRRRWERAVHPSKQAFMVLAIARIDGRIVWRRTAIEAVPNDTTHRDATWASASPVTDGEAVFAQFGSQGLYAYTLDGKLLWSRDLGDMRTRNGFGEGSSPVVFDDKLVVNWDHEDDSFLVVLDKATGEDIWRKERDEVTSWSTPLVVEVGDKPQIVVPGTGRSRGYDLATGEVIWEVGGMTVNVVPSPVVRNGVVYLMSGFRGAALQAVKLAGAKGDLSESDALLWTAERDTPYVPSPLLYEDRLYFLKVNSGILSVKNATTGDTVYGPQRLDGIDNIYASPVAAAGRIYIAGRDGTTLVIEHGDTYKVLAENSLDEGFDASPAIVGKTLYLRGTRHLYSLIDKGAAKPGEAQGQPATGR